MLDAATGLTLQDRIDNYRQALPFPVCMAVGEDGRLFGIWEMGADYRVQSGYYGGYPAGYLRRIRALFPEKRRAIHIFSGKVDLNAFPGDPVAITPALSPPFLDH